MSAIAKKTDIIIAAIVLAASGALAISLRNDFNTWGVPGICIGLAVLLACLMIINAVFTNNISISNVQEAVTKEKKTSKGHVFRYRWKSLLSMFLIVIFFPVSQAIGFPIALVVFIFALLYLGGESFFVSAIFSIGITFSILIIFTYLVYLPLPLGVGSFRDLSLLILYFSWGS